ncbi:MAG: polyketide synthase, partial [Caldilineaceae bacterium]
MSKETALLETLVKEAYKKITALEAQLESAQQHPATQPEPIAVIGMGCRFPGADSPDAYWHLLLEGRCAIRDLLPTRWDPERYASMEAATTSRTAWSRGGFLDQIDQFDPLFFRISPLEAMTMDPQQRLLLEVTWEALEHAALAPDGLEGSKTGVFIGMTGGQNLADLELIRSEKAMYAGTGQTPSIAAGRISYILGLQGPCLAVDTACSSSMMAVHVAVGSLRTGESDLALAGGVNILTPEANVLMANAGWLAADGHCKTFDVAADGHTRSEGCGMFVLKRLADAQRDGDKIWAVIRGSACNHDGRTSGLTVPNGPMQQALIRQALQNAGVRTAEISYSEAHATGTS